MTCAAGAVAGVMLCGDALFDAAGVALFALAGVAAFTAAALVPATTTPLILIGGGCLAATALGAARLAELPAGALARALADGDGARVICVDGSVDGLPLAGLSAGDGSEETRFRVRVDRATRGGVLEPARGVVTVRVPGTIARPMAGERVRVTGRLSRARDPDLDDERDVRIAALDRRSVASIRSAIGAVEIGPAGAWRRFLTLPERLRESCLIQLRSRFDGEMLAMAAAVVLGLYDYASPKLLEAHAATGALPYLAVSGLNVTIIAAMMRAALGRFGTHRERCAMICIAIAAYGAIAGFGPPVFRGVAAAFVSSLAPLAFRRAEGVAALAAAAFAESLVEPAAPQGPSFQLSYAAVLGFVLVLGDVDRSLLPFLPEPRPGVVRWIVRNLRQGVAATLTACLATAGVSAAHFGELAPGALVLLAPMAVLIPVLILFGLAACVPGPIGDLGALLFAPAAAAEIACVRWLDTFPGTPWIVRQPPICVGLVALALLALLARRPRVAAAALICGLAPAAAARAVPTDLELRVHDVDHGLAVSVLLPGGAAMQYDAGSRERPSGLGERIAGGFERRGIFELAAAAQSHSDADHANAYIPLLRRVPARMWIAREPPPIAEAGVPLLTTAPRGPWRWSERGASVEWCAVGGENRGRAARTNDQCVVATYRFGGRTILLPGDLELDGVEELLRSRVGERVDVLLLPHHGLDNGQLAPLLDALQPSILVASRGARYRIDRAVAEAAERGIPLHTTHECGTLVLRLSADGAVHLVASRAAPPLRPP